MKEKGGATPGMAFDKAGPLTETVLLGNVSIRAGKKTELGCPGYEIPQRSRSGSLPPS